MLIVPCQAKAPYVDKDGYTVISGFATYTNTGRPLTNVQPNEYYKWQVVSSNIYHTKFPIAVSYVKCSSCSANISSANILGPSTYLYNYASGRGEVPEALRYSSGVFIFETDNVVMASNLANQSAISAYNTPNLITKPRTVTSTHFLTNDYPYFKKIYGANKIIIPISYATYSEEGYSYNEYQYTELPHTSAGSNGYYYNCEFKCNNCGNTYTANQSVNYNTSHSFSQVSSRNSCSIYVVDEYAGCSLNKVKFSNATLQSNLTCGSAEVVVDGGSYTGSPAFTSV